MIKQLHINACFITLRGYQHEGLLKKFAAYSYLLGGYFMWWWQQ